MTSQLPTTMQALALTEYGKPSSYHLSTLPVPKIKKPDEIIVRVHAASINPGEIKVGTGLIKALHKETFPLQIGYDFSGTVVSIGDAVHTLKPGDAVFGRVSNEYRGTFADYVLMPASAATVKPSSIPFVEAAALPLAGMTAITALQIAEDKLPGGLKGKTVLVPAGLSGTGHYGLQMAKNVFGAAKVITTLSTAKIPQFESLLGSENAAGVEIIDYTKGNVAQAIGAGKVDFVFDTMGDAISLMPVVKKGGLIVSIGMSPTGTRVKETVAPGLPWIFEVILNFVNWIVEKRMGWNGVSYVSIIAEGDEGGLEKLKGWAESGKVKTVVGATARWDDFEKVKAGAQLLLDGKGGVGKFVIVMIED